MNLEKYNPNIKLKEFNDKKIISFEFEGLFTQEKAEYAINRIAKLIFMQEGKTSLVWNCLKMQNYEEEARNICQQMIIDNREIIGKIYLIANSTEILAAAEIISFFSQNNIKFVTSEKDFIDDFTKS